MGQIDISEGPRLRAGRVLTLAAWPGVCVASRPLLSGENTPTAPPRAAVVKAQGREGPDTPSTARKPAPDTATPGRPPGAHSRSPASEAAAKRTMNRGQVRTPLGPPAPATRPSCAPVPSAPKPVTPISHPPCRAAPPPGTTRPTTPVGPTLAPKVGPHRARR